MRIFRPTLIAALAVAGTAHAGIVISGKPTQNMTCSGGVCSATAAKAFLNVDDLEAMLAGGDVSVASDSVSGDIRIDAQVRWAQSSRLTLDAYRSIVFDKALTVGGRGGLTLRYNDGAGDGDLSFVDDGHVKFGNRNASLVINGVSYVLAGTLDEIAAQSTTPFVALRQSINAAGQTYTASPVENFSGFLEGLGNTVSNLTINPAAPSANVGLIGRLRSTGSATPSVRDLGVVGVHIEGSASDQTIGALVGVCNGCRVANSYATGEIAASTGAALGGLVGQNSKGFVQRSHAAVTVSGGAGALYVGGLVGRMIGSCLHACLGTVAYSYATGAVSGADGVSAGGLIGYDLEGVVASSYATGSVTVGNNAFAGGFMGTGEDDNIRFLEMNQTYSTGLVSGGTNAKLGGFIGRDLTSHTSYNNYWDLDTSGISDPHHGAGDTTDDEGITGLTTSQFQSGLPQGFYPTVWGENAGINGGLPYLLALPPE